MYRLARHQLISEDRQSERLLGSKTRKPLPLQVQSSKEQLVTKLRRCALLVFDLQPARIVFKSASTSHKKSLRTTMCTGLAARLLWGNPNPASKTTSPTPPTFDSAVKGDTTLQQLAFSSWVFAHDKRVSNDVKLIGKIVQILNNQACRMQRNWYCDEHRGSLVPLFICVPLPKVSVKINKFTKTFLLLFYIYNFSLAFLHL